MNEETIGLGAEATGGIDLLDAEERDMQGAKVITPPRRDVDGHGDIRAPETRLPQRGHEWLPRFLRKLGIRMWVRTVGTSHGPLKTF